MKVKSLIIVQRRESVLSIEEFEGETFVFYKYMGGLGVANMLKVKKVMDGKEANHIIILRLKAN